MGGHLLVLSSWSHSAIRYFVNRHDKNHTTKLPNIRMSHCFRVCPLQRANKRSKFRSVALQLIRQLHMSWLIDPIGMPAPCVKLPAPLTSSKKIESGPLSALPLPMAVRSTLPAVVVQCSVPPSNNPDLEIRPMWVCVRPGCFQAFVTTFHT